MAELVSIDITPKSLNLPSAVTQQLTATGIYSDNTTQDLTTTATWASKTSTIASVGDDTDTKGLAQTLSAGDATITATSGSVVGTLSITVNSSTLTQIQVTPDLPSYAQGLSTAMTATGVYSNNSNHDITKMVTWTSSDSSKATVSNSFATKGKVTGIGVGTASITATYGAISDSETYTTTAATVTSIQLTPSTLTLAKDTTRDITATGLFTDNSNAAITSSATWTSSNTSVATVTNAGSPRGRITAVNAGTAIITATSGSASATITVTVTTATLTSIAVTPATPSTPLGSTRQFTATGTFNDNSTQDLTNTVTWSSSDTGKATISNAAGSQGLASTVATGNSTITATLNAVSGTTVFTVSAATLVSIAVTPTSPSLALGSTQQFVATGTYTDATTQVLTTSVTWSSTNTSAATISNAGGSQGLATALAVGSTTIRATSGSIVGSAALTTTAAELVSIAVTPANTSIAKGLTQQFVATGTYTDSTTQVITTQVTWTSSNTAKATISNVSGSKGLLSTLATGTSTITATLGGVSGNTGFTVNAAALVSISVTPATPSVTYGSTQQFVATGTYTDSTTAIITGSSAWASSDTAKATINASTGLATPSGIGTTTISATKSSITGSTVMTVAAQAAPSNPTGLSATVNSSSQITVSWTGSATSYKIAYQSGSTAPADCSSGTVVTSSTSPKAVTGLTASTQYTFRVCSVNGNPTPDVSSGAVTSPATTNAAPTGTITVTAPNGGETWGKGANRTFTWTSVDVTGDIKIEYSSNGGSTWSPYTVVDSTANTGTYTKFIACSGGGVWSNNATAKIKISSVNEPSIYDISDANFTVNANSCP